MPKLDQKISTLRDLVVIKPLPPKEKTDGGIIIPIVAQTGTGEGIVHSFGKKVHGLKEGDKVLYMSIAGYPIQGENELVLVKQCHIYGIME